MFDSSNALWRRRVFPYAIAVAIGAAAAAAELGLQRPLGGRVPFAVAPLAVVLTAWLAGVGPGILATAVAVLAGDYYLVPPFRSMRVDNVSDAIGLLLFAAAGVVMC